ncbi:MAG: class II glutamine amidotransferase [Anaerolineae bacterium]
MCGLVGVLLFPKARSPEERRALLDITTSNLLANEERGRDAAGVAVFQRDGRYVVFKQPTPASALVEMPGYHAALSTMGAQTVCILGHTRSPTKGSRWRNVNNHPLVGEHVVGVHNGEIENDEQLFAALRLPRRGEVDSEIIFRLQESVDPRSANGRYCAALRPRLNLLKGHFATLSIDLRKPTQLLALKYLRPLCLHYEASSQALFFSSRYLFLRRAFGRAVITEALDSGFGFCFDALEIPRLGSTPVERFALAPGTVTSASSFPSIC